MDFLGKISAKISEIQAKPEKEKVKIIWILAIIILLMVVIIWIGLFSQYGISLKSNQYNPGVFGDLKNNLEKQFKDKFGKIQIPKIEIPKNIPSEPPALLK